MTGSPCSDFDFPGCGCRIREDVLDFISVRLFVFTKSPLGFEINVLFTLSLAPTGHPIGPRLTQFQVCLSSIPKLRLVQARNLIKPRAGSGSGEGKVWTSRGRREEEIHVLTNSKDLLVCRRM